MKIKINNNINLSTYLNSALNHIMELMKFKSISGKDANDSMPFGPGCDQALDYIINLSQKLGLKTHVHPGRMYGYAEYGSGPKIFGILLHLDVVPGGDPNKWLKSPWNPVCENGFLYGRGSLDDKGPAIINLFAMKYLMDHGFIPSDEYTIRFIFGLSEETNWKSIRQYLADEGEVATGYVPDGVWPVVYAEKGILNFDIIGPGSKDWLIYSNEGVYNMVCEALNIKVVNESPMGLISNLIENDTQFNRTVDQSELIIQGVGAHGSDPFSGENAILKWINALDKTSYNKPEVTKWISDNFGKDHQFDLQPIFKGFTDETGGIVGNIGFLHIDSKESIVGVGIRVPISLSELEVKTRLEKNLSQYQDLKIKHREWDAPKHIAKNDPRIQTLLNIYRRVSGNTTAEPVYTGGGTYARACKNLVAFGACEDFRSMHSPNEKIAIKDLTKMLEIYINAINELAG